MSHDEFPNTMPLPRPTPQTHYTLTVRFDANDPQPYRVAISREDHYRRGNETGTDLLESVVRGTTFGDCLLKLAQDWVACEKISTEPQQPPMAGPNGRLP